MTSADLACDKVPTGLFSGWICLDRKGHAGPCLLLPRPGSKCLH